MTPLRFTATPTPSGTELHLLDGATAIPVASWAMSGHSGAAQCDRFLVEGTAIEQGDTLLVEHAAIARLKAGEAKRLDLPPATTLRAVIEGSGIMMRSDFTVSLRWTRPGGQNVLGIQRTGAWLREADGWRRLPEALFAIAEAVDAYAAGAARGDAERLSALAALQKALPDAAMAGAAAASGLLGTVAIVEADALSLDMAGEGEAMQLIPVLHRAGEKDNAPLLPEDRQRTFGRDQFPRFPQARSVYTLPGGMYLVLAPPLRQALDVVRRVRDAPPAERRAFLREPRAAIRAAIGDEADAAVLDALVVETEVWSERVIGLGLWQKRVLPWVKLAGNDWLGDSEIAAGETHQRPETRGLIIGDEPIPLTPEQIDEVTGAVEAALAQGRTRITHPGPDGPVEIPATSGTLEALRALAAHVRVDRPRRIRVRPGSAADPPERDGSGYRSIRSSAPRASGRPALLPPHVPESTSARRTFLAATKLERGETGRAPGRRHGPRQDVQGLAFCAWLREGMAAGVMPRAPLLIVAPTGLLENWRAEHGRHLNSPGLGEPVLAYGKGLAALRRTANGLPHLDVEVLRAADWVLTTYTSLPKE